MFTKDMGKKGEDAACRYLKKQGYTILARNYSKNFGKIIGEIDIIARRGDEISFVEVKTRQSADYGLPCEAVTKQKQQKIIRTAYTYIEEEKVEGNYSFDIIEVYHTGSKIVDIRHLPYAFSL